MFDHQFDALAMGTLPEVHWVHDDDLCDCTFQRIGLWTNPYIGRTLKVRFCCVWKELLREYPDFVQEIPAFYDYNNHKYISEPWEWDSRDSDMPRAIWYRQIQAVTGRPLDEIRMQFRDMEPPKRRPA